MKQRVYFFYIIFLSFLKISSANTGYENTDSMVVVFLNDRAKQLLQYNIDSSQTLLDSALNISEEENLKKGEALTLKNLGTLHFRKGNYNKTEKLWKKSLLAYQDLKDKKGISDLYNNIGVFYFQMKQIDSALKYHNEALNYRIKIGDSIQIANSYGNMGIIYRNQGEYHTALKYYHKATKIREILNDSLGMADSYNSIGLIYYLYEKYDKAIEYYNKAMEIRIAINYKKGIAGSYNNLAGVYKHLENYPKAKHFFTLFLNLSKELNDKRGVAGAYNNLALIYRSEKDFKQSLDYFLKSNKLFKELNDKQGIAISSSNIGMLYLRFDKYNEAKKHLKEGLNIAVNIGDIDVQKTVCKSLSDVYAKQADFKNALVYYKAYKNLNDSVFNQESANKIIEMNKKYESEKKQQEIVFLKKAAENQKQKAELNAKVRNWAVAGIFLSLLIVLLGYNYFRQKRKLYIQREKLLSGEKEEFRLLTKMQQKEIENKSRELVSYATGTLEKNELLIEIKHKLKLLKDTTSIANTTACKELEHIIKSSINLDSQWNIFKTHFESVHPDFFTKLELKFPSLTVNDLKNCAYIRMNLSLKEVATLMNISPKSVKMTRYRLKKKLNLRQENDLHKFITNI